MGHKPGVDRTGKSKVCRLLVPLRFGHTPLRTGDTPALVRPPPFARARASCPPALGLLEPAGPCEFHRDQIVALTGLLKLRA